MSRARRINVNTMVVTEFRKDSGKRKLKAAGKNYAEWLQKQTANLYDKEKVVGGKLAANTKEYDEAKKAAGLDPKRGHATNETQDVLDEETLTEVTVRGKKGKLRVIIVIKPQLLYDFVPYIRHYENKKVPNETITAFKPGWARNHGRFFIGL